MGQEFFRRVGRVEPGNRVFGRGIPMGGNSILRNIGKGF